MQDNQVKQIARWVALISLFLVPLTPLIVANPFFFPFITGKAFYFRIIVEIAISAWAVLAFIDKDYRPRLSWVSIAVLSFVGWMFIADLFAINVTKAFWSNFERMEGWVLLAHLLGLFFAASAVLRTEKKWRAWFLASLGVSLIVSGYALLQLGGVFAIHQGSSRIDATLGNSAYLAIYFLFNTFIAIWLALTEKCVWFKRALLTLAALEGVLIFFTETRGTVLGLVVGLGLASMLAAFTGGKHLRRFAVGALAVIVLAVGGLYLARSSSFVQNNHVLQRITSISLADGSTRFTIWHMALEGITERPIVGWGQEGFNYIFNEYYEPSLYAQEPWFDRAHNAFIDWLAAGGIPAFLFYLALFGITIVMLWRNSELSRPERIALTAALVGYAIHNLFVFDNLYSYVYFFAILAFVDSQIARPIKRLETAPELGVADRWPVLTGAVILAIVLVWTINVPGMTVATNLINAMNPTSADLSANIAEFKDLSAHSAFAAQEVREQLVSFAASVTQSQYASTTQKNALLTLAVGEMQKQIAAYPLDAREHLELSFAYRAAGDTNNALNEVQAAKKLSPKKESIWIEAGSLEWIAGDMQAAQQDFNMAYELGPQFNKLALYAAAGDIGVGDLAGGGTILQNSFGTTTVDSDVLAAAYYYAKAWPQLIGIWKLRANKPDANAQTWFGLAAAYYAGGQSANAIATLNTAVKLFPDAATSATVAIKQIEAGK